MILEIQKSPRESKGSSWAPVQGLTGSSEATWHSSHPLDSIDLLHSMMLNRRSRRRCHRHNPLLHRHSCRKCKLCSSCKEKHSAEPLPLLAELQKSQMATPTRARSLIERTFSSEYSRKNSETELSQMDLKSVLIWLIPPHTQHGLLAVVFAWRKLR